MSLFEQNIDYLSSKINTTEKKIVKINEKNRYTSFNTEKEWENLPNNFSEQKVKVPMKNREYRLYFFEFY